MTRAASEISTPARLAETLQPWLSSVLGEPVDVVEPVRLAGGASQEAWGFSCLGRRLVLRRDLGGMIYDYGVDRHGEYRMLQLAHRAGVQVPRPIAYTPDLLGRPAFVMDHLDGEAIGRRVVRDPRYASVRPDLVQQLADNLAVIHGLDVLETPFLPAPPATEEAAVLEVDRMQGQLDRISEPHPALELGLRWLRRHLPRPGPVSVVHGDFRTGNFLWDAAGGVHGVLDWEMSHLGDPLEDLGWSLQPVWSFGREGRAGGLCAPADAIAAWERASGLTADPAALHWWILFNCVKGQGIWVGSAAAFNRGGNKAPIMVYPAWWLINAQDRAMLKVMGRL